MRRFKHCVGDALALLLFLSVTLPYQSNARTFVLPGVYYDDEFGIVGMITLISENRMGSRVESSLQYFGAQEGLGQFFIFIPGNRLEWTFSSKYQINETDAYSPQFASNNTGIVRDVRRWTEIWSRLDFLKPGGTFYGFEAGIKRYDFKGSYEGDLDALLNPSISLRFTEGYEYVGSLRVGVEKRDNRYYTRGGYYSLFQLDVGQVEVQQEFDPLIRVSLDVRKYISLIKDWSILAVNLRGGSIHSEVPYFSQFKLGGSQSLRGFPLDRYHGNSYWLARTEMRQTTLKNLRLPMDKIFGDHPEFRDYKIDTGFVIFTEFGDMYRRDEGWWGVRQNIGVGLRAIFPPNVVAAIDVATPLDSDYVAVYLDLRQSF